MWLKRSTAELMVSKYVSLEPRVLAVVALANHGPDVVQAEMRRAVEVTFRGLGGRCEAPPGASPDFLLQTLKVKTKKMDVQTGVGSL